MQLIRFLLKILQVLAVICLLTAIPTLALAQKDVKQEIHKALVYMDRKNAGQAIPILLEIRALQPANRDIEITLASAYVGLTRITIKDFIPLFKQIKANEDFSEQLKQRKKKLFTELSVLANKNDIEVQSFLEKWQTITEVTDSLMYVLDYIRLLPEINSDEFIALDLASEIYQNAEFPLTKGDAAFALLIDLVLLKYKIKQNYYFSYLQEDIDLSTVNSTSSIEGLRQLKIDLLKMLRHSKVLVENDAVINKNIERIEEHWSSLEVFLLDADRERVNLLLYCVGLNYDCK